VKPVERIDRIISDLQALRAELAPDPPQDERRDELPAPLAPVEADPRAWLRANYRRIACGKTHEVALRRVQSYLRITRAHAEKLVAEFSRR
jgi:hypothetical protein